MGKQLYQYTTNEDGEVVAQRKATDEHGNQQWVTVDGDIPSDIDMYGEKIPTEKDIQKHVRSMQSHGSQASDPLNEKNAMELDAMTRRKYRMESKSRAQELFDRGGGAVERDKFAREFEEEGWPYGSNWLKTAGALFGKKALDVKDGLTNIAAFPLYLAAGAQGRPDQYPVAPLGAYQAGQAPRSPASGYDMQSGIIESNIDRRKETDDRARIFKELSENAPLMNTIAESAIMLPTQLLAGPAASKLAEGALSTVSNIAKAVVKSPATAAANAVKTRAAAGGSLAKELDDVIVSPLVRNKLIRSKTDPYPDDYWTGSGKDIIGQGMLGGFEGAIDATRDPLQSSFDSLVGGGIGKYLGAGLSKATKAVTKDEASAISNLQESYGYKPHIGISSGLAKAQIRDASRRRNPGTMNAMQRVDEHNDRAIGKAVADAMGFKKPIGQATYDDFADHVKGLKKDMNDLQSVSSGYIRGDQIKSLDKMVDVTLGGINKKDTEQVKRLVQKLSDLRTKTKDPDTGRVYTSNRFEGRAYQDTASLLKSAKDEAFVNGKHAKGKAIGQIIDALDEGMMKGIKERFGDSGDTVLAKWKDTREKYALTQMGLKNAIVPGGRVDLSKLGAYMNTSDEVVDTLTRMKSGDRKGIFQDLAVLAGMEKRHRTASIDNINNDDVAPIGVDSFLTSPKEHLVTPIQKIKMGLHRRGIPSVTGIGASQRGVFSPMASMRRGMESSQMPSDSLASLMDIKQSASNAVQGASDITEEIKAFFEEIGLKSRGEEQ